MPAEVGGRTRQFREQRQQRSDERLQEAVSHIADDIAEGQSYHQVASLPSGPIRTRSSKAPISEGPLWNNDGNAFGPKVATILHSQMQARGMADAEVVHPNELSALKHDKLPERRMDAPLVAVRAGGAGLQTDPDVVAGIVVRPSSSYDLLHVESQTTLRPSEKRLMDGRNKDERATIKGTVEELVRRSGVQLKTHGGDRLSITAGASGGPQVAHPSAEKFGSAAEWATSVMRSVSTAIARSGSLSAHVQDEELGRRAVARARRGEGRMIPAGGTRYAEVRSEAVSDVASRAVKAIAARENVYLATDKPRDRAEYDKETRTFHPERKPARIPGPDTREQRFNERMLVDLAAAVGTPAERRAAKAADRQMAKDVSEAERIEGAPRVPKPGRSLEVAQLAGVQVPGRNPAPEGLSSTEERARTSMVGDLAARTTLERLGIQYSPAAPTEQARKEQSAYARQPDALDQAWREAASVRGHLVSRDWDRERTPEMIEHSGRSTFEAVSRDRGAQAQEQAGPEQAGPEQPAKGGSEQPAVGGPADKAVEPAR